MRISPRSRRRSKPGPVVGYRINSLVYSPDDVTIIYGPRRRPVRSTLQWARHHVRANRKFYLICLLIIVLCALSAWFTAQHPT